MKTVMSELMRIYRIDANTSIQSGLDIERLMEYYMPNGSGFDNGVELVSLTPQKAVFEAPFHHRNEHGMYDGWVTYIVTVRATLNGPDVKCRVKGYDNTARKYADWMQRDYIEDTFYNHLFDKDIGE